FYFSSCQGRDDRPVYFCRDARDRTEVAHRSDRKSTLDHVNSQSCQLMRHLHFFVLVQAASRRLFAIAQGGVEDFYVIPVRHDRLSTLPERRHIRQVYYYFDLITLAYIMLFSYGTVSVRDISRCSPGEDFLA